MIKITEAQIAALEALPDSLRELIKIYTNCRTKLDKIRRCKLSPKNDAMEWDLQGKLVKITKIIFTDHHFIKRFMNKTYLRTLAIDILLRDIEQNTIKKVHQDNFEATLDEALTGGEE